MTKGLIHIYTGDGKGKTTSAIGLATRALGGGLKVCYVSLHKNPEKYGYTEMDSLRVLGAKVLNRAKGHPHLNKSLDPQLISTQAKEALVELKDLIASEDFDLLIIDEVLISVRDNYISEDELLDFMKSKPESLELVLTGRGATEKVIEQADYVSFVQKVKHPYDKGITSRKGIEF